jgi:hypothetical protein
MRKASILVNSSSYAKNFPMSSCVLLPFSLENVENLGILVPWDMGHSQINCHRVFDMNAPHGSC